MKKSIILLLGGLVWGFFIMSENNLNNEIIDFRPEFLRQNTVFNLNALQDDKLYNTLIQDWQNKLNAGIIQYNPEEDFNEFPVIKIQEEDSIKYSFFHIKKRAKRPNSGSKKSPQISEIDNNIKRVRKPNELNPFQTLESYINSSSFIVSSDKERIYFLQPNYYPIYKNHFLFISTIKDKSQYIASYQEIFDALELQNYLDQYNFNITFNSNNAGSSINVWHMQIAKLNVNFFKSTIEIEPGNSDFYVKEIKEISLSNRVFLSKNIEILSKAVFDYIDILNSNNNPYNLIFFKNFQGYYGIIIFIRSSLKDWHTNILNCKTSLDHPFGFAECIGDFLVQTSELYLQIKDIIAQEPETLNDKISCWQKCAGQSEDKLKKFDSLFFT